MVEYSTNDAIQLSSSVASSIFHEDNIRVASINIVEEKIFHLSSLFFHDSFIFCTSVWKSDTLDVLEEGSNLGDVEFFLLGSMFLMYSYMINSTDFQICIEDGRHLRSLGANITYCGLKLKFQVFLHALGFVLTLVGLVWNFKWLPNLLSSIVEEIKHMFWEHDPLLRKKKIAPVIFI